MERTNVRRTNWKMVVQYPWFRKLAVPGAAPSLGQLIVPGAALLIVLGVLGYLVSTGGAHHAATESAPGMANSDAVAVPPALSKSSLAMTKTAAVLVPKETSTSAPVAPCTAAVETLQSSARPTRLALNDKHGRIGFSGAVGDDATRTTITDVLKTTFGVELITGDITVDQRAGPIGWPKDFQAALETFKTLGSQALLEGDAASVRGAIPDADRCQDYQFAEIYSLAHMRIRNNCRPRRDRDRRRSPLC